jgi:isochorismate synthase
MDDTSAIHRILMNKEPFLFFAKAGERELISSDLIDLSRFVISNFELTPFSNSERGSEDLEISKEEYILRLGKMIEELKSGEYEKAVFSRIKKVDRGNDPALLEKLFMGLMGAYPLAHIFLFKSRENQLWIGASPELLFRKRGKKIETMALAGTQKKVEGQNLSEYTWGGKEIREHQVVADFIISKLEKLGITGIHRGEMETVEAGQVVHLKTKIEFETEVDKGILAETLHPTPAVGGFPRDRALLAIANHELHRRNYYAGYIGVHYSDEDSDYIVNLRCMRVFPSHFSLFVGGGINAQSDPESEWQETELKSRTLIDVIAMA